MSRSKEGTIGCSWMQSKISLRLFLNISEDRPVEIGLLNTKPLMLDEIADAAGQFLWFVGGETSADSQALLLP